MLLPVQGAPLPITVTSWVRVRVRVPSPQVSEQEVQAGNGAQEQSRGQTSVLQSASMLVDGQALPPYLE